MKGEWELKPFMINAVEVFPFRFICNDLDCHSLKLVRSTGEEAVVPVAKFKDFLFDNLAKGE